jgi:hypothetical protein
MGVLEPEKEIGEDRRSKEVIGKLKTNTELNE